jgi:hypothetical protein
LPGSYQNDPARLRIRVHPKSVARIALKIIGCASGGGAEVVFQGIENVFWTIGWKRYQKEIGGEVRRAIGRNGDGHTRKKLCAWKIYGEKAGRL